MATKWCTKLEAAWKRCPIVFSCDQAALQMVFSVCPSVCVCVCPSVRPSVCHTFLPEASFGLWVLSLPVSVCVSVPEKLSWFIRHLSDGLYTLYIVSNLSHRTFGPSQWKCLMCPMIFMNTGVCVCVNHLLVRTITCHLFKLGSPNLVQRSKTPWLRSLLFWGAIDCDLQG